MVETSPDRPAGRSFIGQVPFFLLAFVLCWISLPNTRPRRRAGHPPSSPSDQQPSRSSSNLRRVDFLGSALFAAFLVALLLPLELGGSRVPWSDPLIPACVAVAALLLALFVAAERWWAANPLLPLSMFRNRHTVAAFIIMALQCAAQLGVSWNQTWETLHAHLCPSSMLAGASSLTERGTTYLLIR